MAFWDRLDVDTACGIIRKTNRLVLVNIIAFNNSLEMNEYHFYKLTITSFSSERKRINSKHLVGRNALATRKW